MVDIRVFKNGKASVYMTTKYGPKLVYKYSSLDRAISSCMKKGLVMYTIYKIDNGRKIFLRS